MNNNVTYAGYQYDKETGLYYLMSRMYDPTIARFLQEDTYRGSKNDPLSLNLYTYCSNNPIIYVDPTGHITKVLVGDTKITGGYINNGSTYVSVRSAVEALGSKVDYDDNTSTASFSINNKNITMNIKTGTVTVNGKTNSSIKTEMRGEKLQVGVRSLATLVGINNGDIIYRAEGKNEFIAIQPKGLYVAQDADKNVLQNFAQNTTGSKGYYVDGYGVLRYNSKLEGSGFVSKSPLATEMLNKAMQSNGIRLETQKINDINKGINKTLDIKNGRTEILIMNEYIDSGSRLYQGVGLSDVSGTKKDVNMPIESTFFHELDHSLRTATKLETSNNSFNIFGGRGEVYAIHAQNIIAQDMIDSGILVDRNTTFGLRYDGEVQLLEGSNNSYGTFVKYDSKGNIMWNITPYLSNGAIDSAMITQIRDNYVQYIKDNIVVR